MKILIEAMHGMGDVVCMLPMIKDVQENYANAELTILINRNFTKDVLKCSRIKFKSIRIIDAHKKKLDALMQCMKLRKERFDLAIVSANTPVKKSKLMMNIIHAKKTVGIQYSSEKYYEILEDKYHFVEAHYMAIESLGLVKHDYLPTLYASEKSVKIIKNRYGDFDGITIGICVGRGDITYTDKKRKNYVYTRGWGDFEQHVDNMTELIQKFINTGWNVVMVGGKQEEKISTMILDRIKSKGKLINTVGETSIAESIAIASMCNVMVGVDTGMQHVADAVGVSTVSIFGPTNPKTHGAYSEKGHFVQSYQECQYCFGTERYKNCLDRQCLKSIRVNDVYEEVKKTISCTE